MRRMSARQSNSLLKISPRSIGAIVLFALVFSVHPSVFSAFDPSGSGYALADDDDDDGGDDDGGGSGAGSAGQGGSNINSDNGNSYKPPKTRKKSKSTNIKKRKIKQKAVQTQRRAPVTQQLLAQNAPREIVAIGLSSAGLSSLEAEGYRVIQRDVVRTLEVVMVRLSVPQSRTLIEARADVETAGAETAADFNHFYRNQEGPLSSAESGGSGGQGCEGGHCAALQQISWPFDRGASKACAKGAVIGMVDTGINLEHEAFAGQTITRLDAAMPGQNKSSLQHGTAVAAILVGGQNTRTPGIVPSANLLAVDVFHRQGRDERADVYAIVKALDTLHQRGVNLINMSLAGPPNEVLENMIERLVDEKSIIVAAAGNEGPNAPPAYPAAYQAVVAVTAVDSSSRIYRRANQGNQIDFAAPGVNVWTAASIKGAKRNTGTSFAAPFVTATLAAAKTAAPLATPNELVKDLQNAAKDLGKSGFDPVFGNGLIQTADFCGDGKQL